MVSGWNANLGNPWSINSKALNLGNVHTKVTKQLSASPVGQGGLFRIEVLDFDGLKDGPCEIPVVGQFENHRAGWGKGVPQTMAK